MDRRGGPRHRDDKTITAPGNGLNAAAVRAPLVENSSQRGDLHVQIVVLDDRRGSHGVDDLVPRDEVARPSDQHAEDLKSARA